MFALHFLILNLLCSLVTASHIPTIRKRAHRRLAAELSERDFDQHLIERNATGHTLSARASIPSGWSLYVASGNDGGGCYVDGTTRALASYSTTDGNNGIASCISTCQGKGYKFAGMEYGVECYCANTPSALQSAPSSDCNMACPTGSSDKCGSAWRINIYTQSASTSSSGSWSLQGCVSDGTSRALTGYSFTDGGMTVSKCTSACSAQGFSLAGVEYGQECYCGNSLSNGQGGSMSASSCNVNCGGDGSGNCGGAWAMSLYKTTGSSSTTTPSGWSYVGCTRDSSNRVLTLQSSSSSMTLQTCLSACAQQGATYGGVEFGKECYCGKSLNGGSTLADSVCSSTCPGGGSTYCGGSWALSLFKATTTTTTTTTTAAATTTTAATWNYQYCAVDGQSRALTGFSYSDTALTVNKCLMACAYQGFTLAGVENGNECYCGNSLANGLGTKASDSDCSSTCPGDNSSGKCGGGWRISLYSILSGNALSSVLAQATTTTTTTTKAATTTTTTQAGATTTAASSGSYTPTINIPGSGTKYVWAHFIVGNAYPYTYSMWMSDIQQASASGIDGFVLNLGTDSWQPARIQDAYNAARDSGTGFKMMLSFDASAVNCGDGSVVGLFQTYIQNYLYHAAAAQVNGKPAVTTFMGQDCSFGVGSTNNGWATIFGSNAGNVYFMPAYTSDPTGLGGYNIQAEVNWGSAWPAAGSDITTDRDQYYIGLLNGWGKKYVGTVSPLFNTEMSYKNWIWRSDNWLLSQRFEQLISMRDQIDQVEIVSWNDYGESSYIGPLSGAMPTDATYYANDQFPHTDVLSLVNFYARAWKDGRWPSITQDKVWVMARPHAAWATATSSPYGPPDHRDYTQDNFYAQVHLTAPASVTLCAGSSCSTKQGNAGINRFSQPLVAGQGMSVTVTRNGATTVSLNPTYTFQSGTARYNFNYLIKSS